LIKGKSSKAKYNKYMLPMAMFCLAALVIVSLFTGKYPLTLSALLDGDEFQWKIFLTLRLARTLLGAVGGFCLGVSGFVFQTVFRNPLASPDMIGVASGASAGAAAGILLFSGGLLVTLSSFAGAAIAVILVLLISVLSKSKNESSIVLSGIAVHALFQTMLMILKLAADPHNELASIEYWIMGGLSGISLFPMMPNLMLSLVCSAGLLLLQRQSLLLSVDETEARALGSNVHAMRILILGIATLSVAGIISMTGLISFIGLIAPHIARKFARSNGSAALVYSGMVGAILLTLADILARSIGAAELPVSIFTSLLGGPFLIFLVIRRAK